MQSVKWILNGFSFTTFFFHLNIIRCVVRYLTTKEKLQCKMGTKCTDVYRINRIYCLCFLRSYATLCLSGFVCGKVSSKIFASIFWNEN